MNILITGAAGFIGSHLVRTVLGPDAPLGDDVRATALDALTCAGNRTGLASAEDEPGYAPAHDFAEGLAETVTWHRSNRPFRAAPEAGLQVA
ncbi:NAD-dependent epimerase/dehydratase family protein [Streptomyces sp. NPDC048257]|uniref:NAD-dependent epimerase/dehydratase family protein n=1 Tax=Streptomyces sp. NPDC048257 TaxID=3365526 RepID=UPI003724ABAA